MDQRTLDNFLATMPTRIYRSNYKFQQQANGRYVKRRCTTSEEDIQALAEFAQQNLDRRQAKRDRENARYHAKKAQQANSDCSE